MKRTALILCLFVLLTTVFLSCNKKEPLPTYNPTPPVNPTPNPPPSTSHPAVNVPGTSYKFNVQPPAGVSGSTFLATEYIAGDHASKLIITSPHGGDRQPPYMRTRTSNYPYTSPPDPYNDARTFVTGTDTRTRELAIAMANAIKQKTGVRPHLIINHLHRSKLDANRFMEVAAQGDKIAEEAWKTFHAFIDSAKKTINHFHSSGLVLDIHGNGHTPQRTEMGYLISRNDFTNYKNSLSNATIVNKSSIKALVNPTTAPMPDLIKGDYALGTLINEKVKIMTTPSKAYPEPAASIFSDGKYFTGGYNTARHGSKFGGTISAIQIEFNPSVRTTAAIPTTAQHMAEAINMYMDKYFK